MSESDTARRRLTVTTATLHDGALGVIASEPVPATGCCGAMHVAFISRDGRTRCVACDLNFRNSNPQHQPQTP